MKSPFMSPQAEPIAKPIKIEITIDSVLSNQPIIHAERARTCPIERSIPPDKTTIVSPDAKRKIRDDCLRILIILLIVRNSGLNKLKMKIIIINTPTLIKNAKYRLTHMDHFLFNRGKPLIIFDLQL
jgi:hypothetical protein